jgi:predicted 3-demethylubiquinone-9 3-methyltransferase (glyoxalase superfamily)
VNKVTSFITYSQGAEKAVSLYVSLIRNSKINSIVTAPDGSYSLVYFELDGRTYTAMNGGPTFSFSTGFSMFVECDSQAEVDRLWENLTANGGQEGACGWLTDPWGLSWQIVPRRFMELAADPDPERAQRAVNAMLKMKKLVINDLEAAADRKEPSVPNSK